MLTKPRVGIFHGGQSHEFPISLQTASHLTDNLPEDDYTPVPILIDSNGQWHMGGVPVYADQALKHVDIVLNAMHGGFGEDGKFQSFLEQHKVPFTGSDSITSAIGMHKILAKEKAESLGIRVPQHVLLYKDSYAPEDLLTLWRSFPQPSIVKPMRSGSSIGVRVAKSYDDLREGIESAFLYDDIVFVEEYITGREMAVGVIDDFRGEDRYALMPFEVKRAPLSHFSFSLNDNNNVIELAGNLSSDLKDEIMELAKKMHYGIGARDYSQSEFIITPRGIYFIEINTLPPLSPRSVFPKALRAVGSSTKEFLSHILSRAFGRR